MIQVSERYPEADSARRLPTVLYFDHTALMSGGEIALLHLVKALDRTRHTPVVALGEDGPLAEKLKALGIEVHVLPLDKNVAKTRKDSLKAGGMLRVRALMQSMAYARSLARLLRTRQVDLIHTNSLKADLLGGIAGRMARVPVLWHVRDRIAADYLPSAATRVFRLLCHVFPNVIIANSAATLQTVSTQTHLRFLGILPGKRRIPLRVVHDGIPDPALPVLPQRSDPPLIGLVGRISPWKGQHIFVAAAAEVLKQYPSARFQIIGSTMFGEESYEQEVHAQVSALGIDANVEFTGFCEDVYARINALDILVHASTVGEPFGQVVVEGMVAGKPVIATRGGGVPEIVLDGETGYLVPMGDSEAMAKALCVLLSDPVAAKTMGERGRERVLQHFSIALTAQRVQSLYDEFFFKTQPA